MNISFDGATKIVQVVAMIWAILFGTRSLYDISKEVIKDIKAHISLKGMLNSIPKIVFKPPVFLNVGIAIIVLISTTLILYLRNQPVVAPSDFVVCSIKQVPDQNQNMTLRITGTYSNEGTGRVYVLLEDALGQYYLQWPSVKMEKGSFVITNIRPGAGIIQLDLVAVTDDGADIFKSMASQSIFSAFNNLPDGSITFKTIPINSQIGG